MPIINKNINKQTTSGGNVFFSFNSPPSVRRLPRKRRDRNNNIHIITCIL